MTDGVVDLPFSFVLARRGDRVALIDTGFMREGGGAEMAVKFGIPYWISPVRMLAELGVAAGRGHRYRHLACAFRPHGLDRQVPEGADLDSEARAAVLASRRWPCRRNSAS